MKLMEPTYLKYLWRDDIQDINEMFVIFLLNFCQIYFLF